MPRAEDVPPGELPTMAKILFGADEERQWAAPSPPKERTSRVLFPAGTAQQPPAAPDAGAARVPGVLFGSPQPPTLKGEGPKVIASGAIRRRIPCSAADLQRLDPTATAAVVGRALRIVEGMNLDDAHFEDVLRFGSDFQAEHGAIAERALALANDPALQQGQEALVSMVRLFGLLDPERVFASGRPGLADTLKGLLEPPRPPRELFAATYPELLALAQRLQGLEPQLVALLGGLRDLARRYSTVASGIVSYVLAARFIVHFVREYLVTDGRQEHYRSQVEALETRTTSLLTTRATVEVGCLTNDVLCGNVQTLIDAGRGMLEEDLPAFHTAYTAALTATVATADASWLQPARDVHARVIQRLKGDTT